MSWYFFVVIWWKGGRNILLCCSYCVLMVLIINRTSMDIDFPFSDDDDDHYFIGNNANNVNYYVHVCRNRLGSLYYLFILCFCCFLSVCLSFFMMIIINSTHIYTQRDLIWFLAKFCFSFKIQIFHKKKLL